MLAWGGGGREIRVSYGLIISVRNWALLYNLKEWTSLPMPELLTKASCRKDWKRISAESPLMSRNPVGGGTELNCSTSLLLRCGVPRTQKLGSPPPVPQRRTHTSYTFSL